MPGTVVPMVALILGSPHPVRLTAVTERLGIVPRRRRGVSHTGFGPKGPTRASPERPS
jgi:hypothetical protein